MSTRPDFDWAEIDRLIGHIVASPSAHRTTQLSPLDLQPMVAVPHSTEADADRAFAEARAAQPAWAATPLADRLTIIEKFHDLVLDEQSALCDVVQWENGKARTSAMDEVLDIANVCRYYATTAPQLLESTKRRGAFPLVTRVREEQHPIGVVGVISPWNYPLTLAVTDLLPAIIAGNTVVLKPDLQTTLTALMAIDLLYAAGLPKHVVRIIVGEGPVVGPFITERADYIMFTGSTRTGRIVAARAGERLVGYSLELGGKNSCIVLPDADLEHAVDVAVRGAFANAGQLCIGTERILVPAARERAFTDAFVEAVERMSLGSVIGWGADMGPLISSSQLERTKQHITDAVGKGAVVLTGGVARPDLGPLMFAPTVLTNVSDDMLVCKTETFGPLCTLYTYTTEDELVARVNDTDYGLSASIVARDKRKAAALAKRLHVGAVNINEAFGAAYASVDAPMGGMKSSGVGRRHGVDGLLKYTEAQTVATQSRWLPLAPGRFSDETWAILASRAVRILKLLGIK
mgnify:FL=1